MTDRNRPTFARDIYLDTLTDAGLPEHGPPGHLPRDQGERLYCFAATTPRPTALHMHVHQAIEVGMVLSGRQEQEFAGVRFERGPGDVWLCAMWEPHAWRVALAETKTVVLMFLPEFLGDDALGRVPYLGLFTLPPDCRPRVTDRRMRMRMRAMGCEMAREIQQRRPHWEEALRLHLLLLLAELARMHQAGEATDPATVSPLDRKALTRVTPALRAIQGEPWGRLSTAEAAAACALSPSRFSHVFRSAMGVSFRTVCVRARLAFAAQLLVYTERTLREIADAAGFVDGSHFHRAFVKHYGCTPGQYREQAR